MKRTLFYTLLAVSMVLSACSISKNTNSTESNSLELVGNWQETWDTDKTSSDYYRLKLTNNVLTMSCATRTYSFKAISYQQQVLRFQLLNTDKYVGETYIIDYELRLDATKMLLEGKAKTNKGVLAKIVWEKVK